MNKKKSLWVFVATAPKCSFATIEMLNSLLRYSENIDVSLTLSVQNSYDHNLLKSKFPKADFFYPSLVRITSLKDKPRYRSAIHSEILNQAWARKPKSDFAFIGDNDIYIQEIASLQEIFSYLENNNLKAIGTSYPSNNLLQRILGRDNEKPLNVPNCIFCILDLNYYRKFSNICNFADRLFFSDNPLFDNNQDPRIRNKMIDSGSLIYTSILKENKRFIAIKCKNTFHPYFPASIKHFLLGGPLSPEIYINHEPLIIIHHFKKLSLNTFRDHKSLENAYRIWIKNFQ